MNKHTTTSQRGRAEAAHLAHNQKVGGSSPPPAIPLSNKEAHHGYLERSPGASGSNPVVSIGMDNSKVGGALRQSNIADPGPDPLISCANFFYSEGVIYRRRIGQEPIFFCLAEEANAEQICKALAVIFHVGKGDLHMLKLLVKNAERAWSEQQ